ncbi:hypothetical protein B0H63DRAFT_530321 [Podospora didyma]|uniref:Uncharacterized protein n=1 Tax=Podospora didyma TaxID=330526 RepID=A0AAE0P3N5_9PEZI|nr:hypothetical protein B0H63DRAFT_530321 [Podospora didyma]
MDQVPSSEVHDFRHSENCDTVWIPFIGDILDIFRNSRLKADQIPPIYGTLFNAVLKSHARAYVQQQPPHTPDDLGLRLWRRLYDPTPEIEEFYDLIQSRTLSEFRFNRLDLVQVNEALHMDFHEVFQGRQMGKASRGVQGDHPFKVLAIQPSPTTATAAVLKATNAAPKRPAPASERPTKKARKKSPERRRAWGTPDPIPESQLAQLTPAEREHATFLVHPSILGSESINEGIMRTARQKAREAAAQSQTGEVIDLTGGEDPPAASGPSGTGTSSASSSSFSALPSTGLDRKPTADRSPSNWVCATQDSHEEEEEIVALP